MKDLLGLALSKTERRTFTNSDSGEKRREKGQYDFLQKEGSIDRGEDAKFYHLRTNSPWGIQRSKKSGGGSGEKPKKGGGKRVRNVSAIGGNEKWLQLSVSDLQRVVGWRKIKLGGRGI